jgi:hypothetical protein
MASLNDQQHLAIAEVMDLIVGPADMSDDGQVGAGLVKQNRIVRGHQPALG